MIELSDALKAFVREHAGEDTHRLLLRSSRYPQIDVEFAVWQIEGRRKALEKFPSLSTNEEFVYPVKLSMEQCSSEPTALYKAGLVEGLSVADLTGGLGIDAIFMSTKTSGYCYVERNPELVKIATHNFKVCGSSVNPFCAESLEFIRKSGCRFGCIYLDPARRDVQKNRVVRLASCDPDVLSNLDFLWQFTDKILLKASPMLDISQAVKELGCVERVHVIAVKNECKELLFECRKGVNAYSIVCVNLDSDNEMPFAFTPDEESQANIDFALQPAEYLYEPNVSLLKAGAFRLVGDRYNLLKLHPDTHLYTSPTLYENFPGRIFRIMAVGSVNKQTIDRLLPRKRANVAVRNFPSKPEELKKKFGIKDGGDAFLFAVTLHNKAKSLLFCCKA